MTPATMCSCRLWRSPLGGRGHDVGVAPREHSVEHRVLGFLDGSLRELNCVVCVASAHSASRSAISASCSAFLASMRWRICLTCRSQSLWDLVPVSLGLVACLLGLAADLGCAGIGLGARLIDHGLQPDAVDGGRDRGRCRGRGGQAPTREIEAAERLGRPIGVGNPSVAVVWTLLKGRSTLGGRPPSASALATGGRDDQS
jgi:hypothetical protein